MSVIADVLRELFAMFLADGWLTAGVLLLVAAIAVLIGAFQIMPLLGGVVLLIGCLALLVGAAGREAKRRSAQGS